MKAYLVTTGTIFGLIAVLHLLHSIEEWPLLATVRGQYLGKSAVRNWQ